MLDSSNFEKKELSVKINNTNYTPAYLKSLLTKNINRLVVEYLESQNCWPSLWIRDYKTMSEDQKACFIYHCLMDVNYKPENIHKD